jgi:hypothetical protein
MSNDYTKALSDFDSNRLSSLESELAALNKLIFETKVANTVQPVYSDIDMSLSEVTVTDNRHNEQNLIISEQAHIDFLLSGKRVQVIKPKRNKALSKRYFSL